MSVSELHQGDVVSSPSAPILLDVQDMRTAFPTPRGLVRAVDGVSFRLDRGKTLGIVGESGSGKSVLARSIMGILPRRSQKVSSGTVQFDGRNITTLSAAEQRSIWGREISMVFQDPMTALNPVVRLERQLSEGLRHHLGVSRAQARERSIELLTSVGIPDPVRRLRVYPHELSGGMRQRVAIAIALACRPRVLVADEPTTALDVTIQRQILDLLGTLQSEHEMGMMLITHDLGVVAQRTDHVIVMYAGRVVESAPTKVIFLRTRHPYTKALLGTIPRMESPSHTRLQSIPGQPVDLASRPRGCAFASRCRNAQELCLDESPALEDVDDARQQVACFFPVGTDRGTSALAENLARGRTAAGLPVKPIEGDRS